MPKKTPKFPHNVVLTDEASELLQSQPMKILLRRTRSGLTYLSCSSINPDGPYLQMIVVENAPEPNAWELELSIPHHYVAYIVGSSADKRLGF